MITPILIETRRNGTLDVSPPSRSRSSQSHVRMVANTLSRVACLPQAKSGQAHGHPRARTRRILRDVPSSVPGVSEPDLGTRSRQRDPEALRSMYRAYGRLFCCARAAALRRSMRALAQPPVSTGEGRAAVGQPQLRARHAAACLLSARRSHAAARRPRFALFLRRTTDTPSGRLLRRLCTRPGRPAAHDCLRGSASASADNGEVLLCRHCDRAGRPDRVNRIRRKAIAGCRRPAGSPRRQMRSRGSVGAGDRIGAAAGLSNGDCWFLACPQLLRPPGQGFLRK
jgi:hypothetical protein